MKHLFTFTLLIVSLSMFGQKKIVWFDAGLKAQYGGAGLYNQALADDSKYGYTIGSGYSYGGKLGINFGYNGLAIDVMKSTGSQTFKRTPKTVEWNVLDVYTLFRNAKNLGYFEIGPKFSFVDKVTLTTDKTTEEQPKDNYNKNVVSGVVGFGANILGNDGRFSGILGLRFEYAFTDLDSKSGKDLGAPVKDPRVYIDNGKAASHIAFAGVVFELNWGIGYFGKARCGARSKFIMF
jgi:hypothetical protein